MSRFEKGVGYYTKALVEIGFPENCITCRYCPLFGMRIVQSAAAAFCRVTGELIEDVDHRPDGCPAVIVVEKEVQ